MKKKREIVLTASTCLLLELVRLALEILTNSHVRFKHVTIEKDQESGHGEFVRLSPIKSFPLIFIRKRPYVIEMKVWGRWYTARFQGIGGGQVRIIESHPTSEEPMWIVGRSLKERWGEPLFDEGVTPENPAKAVLTEAYFHTLEDYSFMVSGKECCGCGKPLPSDPKLEYYPHPGGWDMKGFDEPQWIMVVCQHCRYQNAIWRLGVPRHRD